MNFGQNLQYLRKMYDDMTQEELAFKLGVARQTISKWELNQGNPELSKIEEICALFNCKADEILFGDLKISNAAYSNIELEMIESFDFIKYTMISMNPEDDAIDRNMRLAKKLNIKNPQLIGWDFPNLSQEQINVYHMHGYTSAIILPQNFKGDLEGNVIEKRATQRYVTITIKEPMINPFSLISNAYKAIGQYIHTNRYVFDHFEFERLFIENGIEYMKICVAIQ